MASENPYKEMEDALDLYEGTVLAYLDGVPECKMEEAERQVVTHLCTMAYFSHFHRYMSSVDPTMFRRAHEFAVHAMGVYGEMIVLEGEENE